MASLKAFLQTGRLGPLTHGVSPDAVRGVLGEPEATSVRRKRNWLWKYGCLQVAFHADQLVFVGLYFRRAEPSPAGLRLVGYFPRLGTTVQEFISFLTAEHVPFRVEPRLTFETQTCYEVGVGVHVLFDEDGRLDSIQAPPAVLVDQPSRSSSTT